MPVSLSAEMKGDKAVQAALDGLELEFEPGNPAGALHEAMWRAVLPLQARMQDYPPTLPNQKYQRTGAEGRHWTSDVRPEGDGLVGHVGNNLEYAPEVQSKEFQRPIFQGRWITEVDALEQERPAIMAEFEAVAATVVKEFGS